MEFIFQFSTRVDALECEERIYSHFFFVLFQRFSVNFLRARAELNSHVGTDVKKYFHKEPSKHCCRMPKIGMKPKTFVNSKEVQQLLERAEASPSEGWRAEERRKRRGVWQCRAYSKN